jgi:hypothetical protein
MPRTLYISYCFDVGENVDHEFLRQNFPNEFEPSADKTLDTDVFNSSFLSVFFQPIFIKERAQQQVTIGTNQYSFQWKFYLNANGILHLFIHIPFSGNSVEEQVKLAQFVDEQHYACYYYELKTRDIAPRVVKMIDDKKSVLSKTRVVQYIQQAYEIREKLRAKTNPLRDYPFCDYRVLFSVDSNTLDAQVAKLLAADPVVESMEPAIAKIDAPHAISNGENTVLFTPGHTDNHTLPIYHSLFALAHVNWFTLMTYYNHFLEKSIKISEALPWGNHYTQKKDDQRRIQALMELIETMGRTTLLARNTTNIIKNTSKEIWARPYKNFYEFLYSSLGVGDRITLVNSQMEVLSGYYLNLNNMLMQKIQLITQQQTEYLEVLFALNFAAVIAALVPAVVLIAGPDPTVSTLMNSFWVRVTVAILVLCLILYLVIPRIKRLSERKREMQWGSR